MARFFKAPIVQPIDYGFKMPFGEIMGALQMKQKAHDTTLAQIGALKDDPSNALSPDYPLRGGLIKERQQRVDAIMYDEQGNLQDLSGKGHLVQAEARRRAKETSSGGLQWALESSQKEYDTYIGEVDKMLKDKKITTNQARYLKERSFYDYAKQGGLGDPTGFGGMYSEQQLFKGLEAAAQVDIGKLGEQYGKGVGELQIQTSGLTVDPNTGKIGASDKDFVGKDSGRFRQTGTLMTVTYDKIYDAVANGLLGDQALNDYLRQEAEAEAWNEGKLVSEQGIESHVKQRIQDEADRAANKFMKAKFEPKVYQDWMAREKAKNKYKLGQIDYEMMRKQRVLQASVPTQQVEVDAKQLTANKSTVQKTITDLDDVISTYQDKNGQLKKEFQNNPDAVDDYKDFLAQRQKAQIELDGIKDTENLLLSETGTNDATLTMKALEVVNGFDSTGRMGNLLNAYIMLGEDALLGGMSDKNLSQVEAIKKQLELFEGDPKKQGRVFTPEMQARAKQIVEGNLPDIIQKQLDAIPFTQDFDTDNPKLNMQYEIEKRYNAAREKGLITSAEVVNNSGGLNYQVNATGIQSMDTDAVSDLGALETTMTDFFNDSNFDGLIISGGDQAGLPLDRNIFLKGKPGFKVKGDVTFRLVRENNDKRGHGGKQQYVASARIVNKQGVEEARNLIVTVDPTKNNAMVGNTVEAATQVMNSVVDDLSNPSAQNKWALASALIGGTTPLIQNMFDQGISNQLPSTNFVYKDEAGRPAVGVARKSNKKYVFYAPVKDKNGEYYINWNDKNSIIKDTRTNFGATGKTEWKNISDFQELVGEKAYEGNLNRMGIHTVRALYEKQ